MSTKRFLLGALLGLAFTSIASVAAAEPLISPAGIDGAGLGLRADQKGRVWGDIGHHKQDEIFVWAPTIGVGIQLGHAAELEFLLPYTRVSGDDDSISAIGNITAGIHYVQTEGTARFRIGGRLSMPTADSGFEGGLANLISSYLDGFQNLALRAPDTTTVSVPFHIEAGNTVVGMLDAGLQLHFPKDADSEVYTTIAPGFGAYATRNLSLGLRVPVFFALSSDADDKTQFSIEPFIKIDFAERAFLSFRFNAPLDDPARKADIWGFFVGVGVAF